MTIQSDLNIGNPNKVADLLQAVKAGDVLACTPRFIANGTVAANLMVLAEDRKALAVLAAYASAGGATSQLTPVAIGATPAAGQVGVSPDGNILFAAADAVTAADVYYLAPDADVEEFTVEVAGSAATLPSSKRAWILTAVEVLTGAILGTKTINARGSVPGAGTANLADGGAIINFNAADVVAGTARIRAMVNKTTGLSAKLAADSLL